MRRNQEEQDIPISLGNVGHLADWDYKLRVKIRTDLDYAAEMMEILEGTLLKPSVAAGASAEDIKAWVRMDRKVQKVILERVDKTMYHVVTGPGADTSFEIYKAICTAILVMIGGDDLDNLFAQMKAYKQTNQETGWTAKLEDYLRIKQDKISFYNAAAKMAGSPELTEHAIIRDLNKGLENGIWLMFKSSWDPDCRTVNSNRLDGKPDFVCRVQSTLTKKGDKQAEPEEGSSHKSKGLKAKWERNLKQTSDKRKNGSTSRTSRPEATGDQDLSSCKSEDSKSDSSAKVAKETTATWGRALMARTYAEVVAQPSDVFLAPLDNGLTSTGFPSSDWFAEESLVDVDDVSIESIDGQIMKPEKKGLGVFRLGNPQTGKYILLSMPDAYLQPTYTDPVIAQRKLGKLPNVSILMKDKEDDPHQPSMIKYQAQEFTCLFPAKDELYYCSIMKASTEEKAQALAAWRGNRALYAAQTTKIIITKQLIHD
ncbi:hypothetical protein HDU77_010459 [Chytriomyces hyalinus]|nr:hypothetical protein HDU77_010459 [Chytriomyces hyalinus]